MKYFAHLKNTYIAKNKAHEDIQEYARSVDGTLLSDTTSLRRFQEDFKKKLAEINAKHKRCHDIEFSGYYHGHGIYIGVDGNFSMSIFEVKHEQ